MVSYPNEYAYTNLLQHPKEKTQNFAASVLTPSFSPLLSPELALNELRSLYDFYKVCTGSSEGAETVLKSK